MAGAAGFEPLHSGKSKFAKTLGLGRRDFEPLHIRIGICQEFSARGRDFELAHLELKARPIDA